MTTPNKSFAVWLSDRDFWLIRPSVADCETISEGQEAFFDRIKRMYTTFGEQFRPTSITYVVNCVETDAPVTQGTNSGNNIDGPSLETQRGVVQNDSGVACDTLLERLDGLAPPDGFVLPARIEFEGATLLYVDQEYQYVDRSSDVFRAWDSVENAYVGDLNDDPVQFRLGVQAWSEGIGIIPSVSFHTDIWFEDSPYGRHNRFQIAAMAARLVGSFDVEQFDYRGNWEDILSLFIDGHKLSRD